MKIGVYMPRDNKLHDEVLAAMALGINAVGDQVTAIPLDEFTGESVQDAAVVFGVQKHAVPRSAARGKVINAYRKAGKHVLVLERGYVRRDEYYAAGWDGLNGRANFCNDDLTGDRWRDLGIELQPYRRSTAAHSVLVIGQVPWDASVQDGNHLDWITSTVNDLMALTPREICVRPHPLACRHTPLFFGTSRSEGDLTDALLLSHAVVTYNSNVGVDALIAGVPVFCADRGAMVYGMAEHDLCRIENPACRDREAWANGIAYTQWTLGEMREGLPWMRLREMLL